MVHLCGNCNTTDQGSIAQNSNFNNIIIFVYVRDFHIIWFKNLMKFEN